MLLTMVGANRKEKTTSDEIMLGLHKPMAGGIYWSNGKPAEMEYLAHAYDLTFLAPVGIAIEAESFAKAIAYLIVQIKNQWSGCAFC